MAKLHFNILTLFPEVFPPYLESSILGRAKEKGLWDYNLINIRDFTDNKWGRVDDTPYGGGAGMVIQAEPIAKALDNIDNTGKIIYLSPRGKKFNQQIAKSLATSPSPLTLICGRYEGIDQRIIDEYNIEEVSVGDYVVSGGELPAMIIIDAILRNVDGVLGNADSLSEESHNEEGSLEYDIYTKPEKWRGHKVPDTLLSGNHAAIAKWRMENATKNI